jgi:hypothetical protein
MTRRLALAVALATTAGLLVLGCDMLVLVHHARHWPHGYTYWLEGTVSQPVWIAVGLLITLRVPGNRLGWVSLLLSVGSGVQLFSGALATQLAGRGPATPAVDWLAAVSAVGQIWVVGGLMVFGYLAPDGRLLSRRWRPLFILLLLTLGFLALDGMTTLSGVQNEVVVARPPFSLLSEGAMQTGMTVANVVAFFALPAGLVSLFLRYRRGSAIQRLQLKWLVLAAFVALFLAVGVQSLVSHYWPHAQWTGTAIWAVIGSCLPLGVAVGVLRYRLYDIDRILSRTVGYLLVTGGVVGVYVGVIALIDTVLGLASSAAVAASTLAAAAAFQPLRRRVQTLVDRRFDRAAYDARRTIEVFSNRLRDQVDADAVRDDLLSTVASAVAPARLSLWTPS